MSPGASDASGGSVRVSIEEREGRGAVARVTVAYERRLNVLNTPILEGLQEAFAQLGEAAREVRVVVLTGAGDRAFIGGADIYEMASLDASTAGPFIHRIHRLCQTLRHFRLPVVARINGHCLGAGLEVALACDLRIASDNATFGMPEVKVGVPSVVEAALLPRVVGAARARALVLSGRVIDAARAEAWGLVEEVVPPSELDASLESWLEDLLAAAPGALRRQKELCRQWEELPLSEGVAAGARAFAESWYGPEPRRYMQRFVERRR